MDEHDDEHDEHDVVSFIVLKIWSREKQKKKGDRE